MGELQPNPVDPSTPRAVKLPVAQPTLAEFEEHQEHPPATEESGERRWLLWSLVAAVLLSTALLAGQSWRASSLEAQVELLSADLAIAEAAIAAHQTHLDAVRTHVGDLSADVAALQALVDRDPLAAAAKAPASDQ